MHTVRVILSLLLLLNTVGAIVTVLRRKRDIATTWAWLLVLLFLPGVGFLFYLFAGRRLSTRRLQQINAEYQRGVTTYVKGQRLTRADQADLSRTLRPAATGLMRTLWTMGKVPLLLHNTMRVYTTGQAKFTALFADIDAATTSVCLTYYTIYPDDIGRELRAHLVRAAARGVQVNVLYDAWGSLGMHPDFWTPLRERGGRVTVFFSSRHILTDFRLNYRNHRKIVVIDDRIAYTGGFNVGDQYMGRNARFGDWRDTHMRLVGDAAIGLKTRFVMDWNATEPAWALPYPDPVADPPNAVLPAQVVSSGPDDSRAYIKLAYVELIMAARQRLWLQTPYLVPDETVMNALIGAALAGVDVRIMIPDRPDHPFIYRATQYYARKLQAAGVRIFHYEAGFMHAKTIICDTDVVGCGSTNCDYRSFELNFEVTTFLYGAAPTARFADLFTADEARSHELTVADIAAQGRWLRLKQQVARMLAPIL